MKLLVALLMCFVSPASFAEPSFEIKTGFLSGQNYLEMPAAQRGSYAIGLVEGMFLSPFFEAQKSKLLWLEQCTTGMNDTQLRAVLDQFVHANPARWHESMHTLGYSALKQACEQPK